MSRGTDNLLTSLKVLGQVRQHERLSTRRGHVIRIETQDWFQPVRRFLWGESRDVNLEDLSHLVDQAIQHLSTQSHVPVEQVFQQRLVNELCSARDGLERLRTTYELDSVAIARIDLLIDRIALHTSGTTGSQEAATKEEEAVVSAPIDIASHNRAPANVSASALSASAASASTSASASSSLDVSSAGTSMDAASPPYRPPRPKKPHKR